MDQEKINTIPKLTKLPISSIRNDFCFNPYIDKTKIITKAINANGPTISQNTGVSILYPPSWRHGTISGKLYV